MIRTFTMSVVFFMATGLLLACYAPIPLVQGLR
jgi:hypothetical protein